MLIVLSVAGIIFALITLNRQSITQEINNFDDCAYAGYPILESYPRQCKTPDNRTFTEIVPPIEPEPFKEPKEGFCGQSTYGKCFTDLDCTKGGCSGEVCQSKDEESIITSCVFRECYNAETFGMQCKCVNEQCQWYKYPRE